MGNAQTIAEQARLLNAKQVGLILGISSRSVFRLRACGKLPPAVKVGGALRFKHSDILEWIAMDCCSQKEFVARKVAKQ